MSNVERVIRIVLALVIAGLIFYIPMNMVLVWVLTIIAIALLVTGMIGYCSIYTLCGKFFKKK